MIRSPRRKRLIIMYPGKCGPHSFSHLSACSYFGTKICIMRKAIKKPSNTKWARTCFFNSFFTLKELSQWGQGYAFAFRHLKIAKNIIVWKYICRWLDVAPYTFSSINSKYAKLDDEKACGIFLIINETTCNFNTYNHVPHF